jgi:hypothetical protein
LKVSRGYPPNPKPFARLNCSRRKAFLAAVALILFGSYLVSGIRYALYRPSKSGKYLWAVYHVHSTMSDGLGSPAEIARQARASGVALVILTDHGNPNLEASAFRLHADGVTIIGGTEARLPDGRLTFFGASQVPSLSLVSSPPQAIDQARSWGAFPVISYSDDPLYGWRYWESDLAPGGIEISNLFSCVRGLSFLRKLLLAVYYPFSNNYFLKDISFPSQSLSRWDKLLARQKTWGLIAADAHGGFRVGKWFSPPVPSYAATFSLAGLGIDPQYASQPELAIRNGDFFNCIRGAGEPQTFNFFATRGNTKFSSGASAPEGSSLHAGVEMPGQALRILLIKDGTADRAVNATHLDIANATVGVYRVEVYLLHHPLLPPNVPWIVSNPIFVGGTTYAPGAISISSGTMETSRPPSTGLGTAAVIATSKLFP